MLPLLVRSNPCYRPQWFWDRRGILIVTRRLILATGTFARCWLV